MIRSPARPLSCVLLLGGILAASFTAGTASAQGNAGYSTVPAPKLDLIKQAMAAMKTDVKIRALVDQRVEMRALRVRGENPGMPDSLYREVRAIIADIYARNTDRPGGLMPRVYALVDKTFTEADLRFAVNFNGSDQGKRYRERVPRVIQESVEIGRRWSESLEPEILRRLEERFRGEDLKF